MSLVEPFDGFEVRFIPAFRANKTYTCPECGSVIPVRSGHVVAWPDDDNERRRHWHSHCWRLGVRRGRIDGI